MLLEEAVYLENDHREAFPGACFPVHSPSASLLLLFIACVYLCIREMEVELSLLTQSSAKPGQACRQAQHFWDQHSLTEADVPRGYALSLLWLSRIVPSGSKYSRKYILGLGGLKSSTRPQSIKAWFNMLKDRYTWKYLQYLQISAASCVK